MGRHAEREAPLTRPAAAAATPVHDVPLDVLEDDPYPTYAWMRRHRPIAYVPETGRVWITIWDLCNEAGRNNSANRDETRFADPDVFDLGRPRQSHVSFGYGVHFCLGHYVARQLEKVMLEEMFTRLPNLRPDPDQETIVHGWSVRAAKRLPVVWDA